MASFIEKENQYLDDPVTEPRFVKHKTWKTIFCSKLAKGIIIALSVAILIPTLAFFLAISINITSNTTETFTCLILEEYRLPCGNARISEDECLEANCCFNSTTNQCHHYLPSKYYYSLTETGTYKASQDKSPVGTQTLEEIKLTIQKKTANQVSLIIHDPSEIVETKDLTDTNYTIVVDDSKLNVNVTDRKGDTILSTTSEALIASDTFWEWGFQLSSNTLFGLDRNRIQLEGNESLTKVIYKNRNDHYTLPVLWAYQSGSFYGVLIRHDGPLEIQILASNIVILRTIVGSKLEVELSLGPTPADLYSAQTENFVAPPLWALGTHNCRKGNSIVLDDILDIYKENDTSYFDTDCIHENLFVALQNSSVQTDSITALQEVITTLNDAGIKFLFSLPPHILVDEENVLYQAAIDLDLLYRNQSGTIYNGTYLGSSVVFPDFSNTTLAAKFMEILVGWISEKLGLDFVTGFVLNDNWPQDDNSGNVDKTAFPYYSEALEKQMQYTLPWNLKDTNGLSHLQNHNLYGEYQNSSLYAYFLSIGKFPLIISSTKSHGGSEPEISDNLETSWTNFNTYLNRILFSSITGNSMVGLPVCGDTTTYNKTLHETLCTRWYLAAATMPYFRVSSEIPFRHPTNLNSLHSTNIAKAAMSKRKLMQDYLFTLFHKDPPVIRPMYFDYFSNESTLSMERQYTIGENIIVAHPLSAGRTRLQVFLPSSKRVWYEFWAGTRFESAKDNYVDIEVFESDLIMFIAQGTIVALTDSSKLNLYIALSCSTTCTAEGELFKDGRWLQFSATKSEVTVTGLPLDDCQYSLGYLRVYESASYLYTNDNASVLCSGEDNVTIKYENLNAL